MSKVTSKIAIPIILVGLFAIAVFIAVDYQNLDMSFYILLSVFIVFVFFFGLATGQDISSPLRELIKKAEELTRGNLSSRVYLETKDEFSELARAINKIAEDLEQSQTQEKNTEKSVDIKVKARTQALEETINALEQKVRNRTAELQSMMKNLEQFQGDSTEKESEIENLKKQIGALEEDMNKKPKKKKTN